MSKRPTFVLVHGAWHGGWAWKKVHSLLQQADCEVFTPTLTGLGERRHLARPDIDLDTHIQDVLGVLHYEDLHEVILVGHSYAGMVIAGVADKAADRLAQLISLDAFLPENDRRLIDYVPGLVPGYERSVADSGDGWRLRFADALSLQALGITDPADIACMSPRMDDQPYKTFVQPVRTSGKADPRPRRVYLLSSERAHYLAAAERAREQGFEIVIIPGAGHDVMVTRPRELTETLIRLARTASTGQGRCR